MITYNEMIRYRLNKFFCLLILITYQIFPLSGDTLIRKGSLGKIKLGMKKSSVLKVLKGQCKMNAFLFGERRIKSFYCSYNGGKVDLEFNNKRLDAIYIQDFIYHTQKGIRVGSKLSDVRISFPSAKLFSGYLEGYYIFMREKKLSINIDFDINSIIYQDTKNYKYGFKVNPKDVEQIKDIRVKMIIISKQ